MYRKLRKGDLYDAALQNIDIFCEEEEETMKENKDGTHIGELLLATFLYCPPPKRRTIKSVFGAAAS